jgi:uncharacterized lipoprotein YmbA
MKTLLAVLALLLAGCATNNPPAVIFAPAQTGPVAPYLGK